MTADVLLREARPGDVAGIQRVAERVWHDTYDGILGSDTVDRVLEEWYADAAIADGIDHEAQDFFVAERDGAVVGYAHAGPHPPRQVHRLYRIYVLPGEQGAGIGKGLLAEVEQALYDRGVSSYELQVLADNDDGVGFYESTGFERVETVDSDLMGVAVREHLYRKEI